MKLPDTMTIGHQVYSIEPKDKSWFRDSEKFGHCDFLGASIAVANEDMNDAHIVNTLIHEVLHALWREYNLPQDCEEHLVTCLANGLTQTFRDNPDFVKVLKRAAQ